MVVVCFKTSFRRNDEKMPIRYRVQDVQPKQQYGRGPEKDMKEQNY
jgi:hypothetical protein